RFDAVDRALSLAGGIRACYRGGWSFVTFNGLDELAERVQEAVEQARLIGHEQTQLAPVEPVVDYVQAEIACDPRTVPLAEKRALLQHYNDLLLSYDPRIQTTSVSYRERFGVTYLVTSTGTNLAQERLDVSGMFGVVARGEGLVVRQGYESVHSRSDYNVVVGIDQQVLEAAQRAIRQLEAQPVKGGQYTVILDPYLSGVFIHEAFGHLSEADFVYENPRLQELLQLGRQVAIPELNVVDDATMPGLPGSLKYDDEGVPGNGSISSRTAC
ncbi:MAG: TldD/PmbA family protein, partial [Gloeomargarita sp. SKYBB_i_bin120]|nr:TldD/PmbA family protein [Gloeomargarita sp. SKYB120]MDW8178913.1 TldD/PmbA family protein [Gloeomargarita sp. SKYBB_i_bin120]